MANRQIYQIPDDLEDDEQSQNNQIDEYEYEDENRGDED